MFDTPKAKIALFLILTFGLSSYFYWRILTAGALDSGGGYYVIGLMWCPGIAAVFTRLVTQRDLAGQGWRPWPPKPLGIAYVLPLLYAAPVYLAAWASGIGGFSSATWALSGGAVGIAGSPWGGLVALATVGVAWSLVSATGEEIGWRGLLVPELAKIVSFRRVALISGGIWASWHMPILIFADYNGGATPILYSLACFVVMAVAISFAMAWLRLASGSLWPCALLHATHNLFVQGVFDSATVDRGATSWLTGEFGAGLAVTTALVAWWAARRAGREAL